jgi:ABC-type Fe3+ transport system permease subunit
MTWEAGSTDQQRLRAGCIVLSIGVFVLLCVWTMAVIRGPEAEGQIASQHKKIDPPTANQTIGHIGVVMLVTGSILIIVLFASVIGLLRISRNYRRDLMREPEKPTPVSDVWQMHKIPEVPPEDHESADDEKGDA